MEHNKIIPTLDVATRWNSTYIMLNKLLEIREFLAAELFQTTTIDWNWIKYTFEATVRLQHKQLAYSDFFILWMELRFKCENSQISHLFITNVIRSA